MDYYNEIASGYDELYEEEQLEKLQIISSLITISPHTTLLDIGCGSGISTRFWDCQRTGIDPSEQLLALAKKNDPQGTYLLGTAERVPFPPHSFDVIISVTAIHHCDITKAIEEMKRVSRRCIVISLLKSTQKYDHYASIIINMLHCSQHDTKKDTIFLQS